MPDRLNALKINRRGALGARSMAITVSIGSLLVLAGWASDCTLLKCGIPGLVAMNPATAILFIIASATIWFGLCDEHDRARAIALRVTAAVVTCGGLITLLTYYFHWNPLIDSVLFASRLQGNRIAPNTAVHFLFVGLSLLLIDARQKHVHLISQSLAGAALIGSTMSLLGYAFGARNLYGIGSYIPMAFTTAFLFACLAIGVLCSRPTQGLAAILTGPGIGSLMARRLLPTAVGTTCALGFLRLLGERAGLYESEFGVAAMVVMNIVLLGAAVFYTAVVLNHIDIERRQVATALRESAERYRFLADSIPGIVWTADTAGNFEYCNSRWYEYTGLTFEQTKGQLWKTVLHSDDLASCIRRWESSLGSGEPFEVEVRIKHRLSGAYRWHLMRGAARLASDQTIAQWLGTCTDVDDQKRAAQEIEILNGSLEQRVAQRTAELAEANRDLRQKNQENEMFVYSVSHDLRSPLVNLQGFSKELDLAASELSELMWDDGVPQNIRQKALALLDGDLRESIRFIQTGVMRLSGIIDALLRLSRVGRIEYRFENVDMNALTNRIVESMGATLFDNGVSVKVHNLSPCYGDVTAIEQLFANLIGNAVKYLDPQRSGVIEIGQATDDGRKSPYFVRDNGLGIPMAYHEKVFDSFKRFHPHAAPGDGMGLAIVRRIAERHSGEVRVESQEGRGSTFYVTLPDSQPPDTPHRTKEGDKNAIRVDGHFVS